MAENEYFKQALSSFAMDMASGGAIKHLTNQGYTVQQIANKLDFPTPYEKVQELVWKQMIENGCLLLEEPGNGTEHEKVDYIQETDSLGRKSFRKVVVSCENDTRIHWKEWNYTWKSEDSFRAFLDERCVKNGEQDSYVRCDFGLRKYRDPKGYERTIQKTDCTAERIYSGTALGIKACLSPTESADAGDCCDIVCSRRISRLPLFPKNQRKDYAWVAGV